MERSRLTYEMTNQQLMGLINKLSSQLSRARIAQPTKQIKDVEPVSSSNTSGSSFRRQKAIRIKKRDSIQRNNSVASNLKAGDSQSYMSSDSGNFSDNDNKDNKDNSKNTGITENTHLQKLLRKGLQLVNNVNHELNKEKLNILTITNTS